MFGASLEFGVWSFTTAASRTRTILYDDEERRSNLAGREQYFAAFDPAHLLFVSAHLKPIVFLVDNGEFGTIVDGEHAVKLLERAVANHGLRNGNDGERCRTEGDDCDETGKDSRSCDAAEKCQSAQGRF